jgi:hypothetical protein
MCAPSTTHEQFIQTVREVVVERLTDSDARHRLLAAKLVYGSGTTGVRGICFYRAWQQTRATDFIEICAIGEESPLQLAGTTIHELAHCLAGDSAGHGRHWKAAARSLGLVQVRAAGQCYRDTDFDPSLWALLRDVAGPNDGTPVFPPMTTRRAPKCPLGRGTRGGSTRGAGSGSRLRLFVCNCNPPVRVRVARDEFSFYAMCLTCNSAFKRNFSTRLTNAPSGLGDITSAEKD